MILDGGGIVHPFFSNVSFSLNIFMASKVSCNIVFFIEFNQGEKPCSFKFCSYHKNIDLMTNKDTQKCFQKM